MLSKRLPEVQLISTNKQFERIKPWFSVTVQQCIINERTAALLE